MGVIGGGGLADLEHELAVHCELEKLAMRLAATSEPGEVVVVDENTVLRLRPLIAGAWTAPRAHQVAGLVEHQHRRCRGAASGQGRILLGRALPLGQRTRALHDPDAIKPIDRDAGDLTEYPIVRQRLRPQGIDLELRNGCLGILRRRGARRRQYAGHGQQSISNAFHHFLPFFFPGPRASRLRSQGQTPMHKTRTSPISIPQVRVIQPHERYGYPPMSYGPASFASVVMLALLLAGEGAHAGGPEPV